MMLERYRNLSKWYQNFSFINMHMLNEKFQNMKSTKSNFYIFLIFLEDNCKEKCISYKKKRYVFPSCSGA